LFRIAVLCLGMGLTCGDCSVAAAAAPVQHVRAKHGMVVSATSYGTNVGRDVLQQGGNAVDAAVATAFSLAVTWPEAGNIGGGGFMLIYPGDGREPVCVDYRETAPGNATVTMFSRDDGAHTHKMVGLPGTVRGLALAHARYGSLPWKKLVMPAVKLARDGFEVDAPLADSLNGVLTSEQVRTDPKYAELRRVYGRSDGRNWKPGDQLVLPDLAHTLEQIAAKGAAPFYSGPIAKQIVAELRRGDGQLTLDDLARYRAKIRKPIRGRFRGHDVYGPPPPSSGGICLVQMLRTLEGFDLRKEKPYSARNIHLITEAMRRAFLDRARHLADADFVKIPTHLTAPQYARSLAAQIDPKRATASMSLADAIPLSPESDDTTHFSVVDNKGMAVANTYTLEASWGSRIVVRGAGFVLNNEMGDFNRFPGYTDQRGYIGTKPNQIAPRKRMLSSQTPTIVARDGRALLVTGSPGGRTIINTVLGIVLGVVEYEMDLPTAVAAPRLHHQWMPDKLYFEALEDPDHAETVKSLRQMGHNVTTRGGQGSAHSIWIDPASGELHGVADRRRSGHAAGY